jgi:hypothetical protein
VFVSLSLQGFCLFCFFSFFPRGRRPPGFLALLNKPGACTYIFSHTTQQTGAAAAFFEAFQGSCRALPGLLLQDTNWRFRAPCTRKHNSNWTHLVILNVQICVAVIWAFARDVHFVYEFPSRMRAGFQVLYACLFAATLVCIGFAKRCKIVSLCI